MKATPNELGGAEVRCEARFLACLLKCVMWEVVTVPGS